MVVWSEASAPVKPYGGQTPREGAAPLFPSALTSGLAVDALPTGPTHTCSADLPLCRLHAQGDLCSAPSRLLIASRSSARFDQLKHQFILRYKYVKHPICFFLLDANKSLPEFMHKAGGSGVVAGEDPSLSRGGGVKVDPA